MNGSATQPGDTMTLIINGEERTVPAGLTVNGLLESLELVPGTVVVERNRAIVPKARHDDVELTDGDRLELVHFVGGG